MAVISDQVTGERVAVASGSLDPNAGNVGLNSQLPGQPTTVSGVADATGGVERGNLIEVDVDQELFRFKSDDTPLMQLMLNAKKVSATSPEVDHYMIDEAKKIVTLISAVESGPSTQFCLPLDGSETLIPRPCDTLLCKGVDGWNEKGTEQTPGKDLMIYITGYSESGGKPIARAVNGPRANETDEVCTTPEIPEGTEMVIMGNAMHETQKWVDPSISVPTPTRVYLQKRGLNNYVSDYWESQKKNIPYAQATIAEQHLTEFKTAGNRTLWFSRKGKFKVMVPNGGGMQYVYTTEGVRYQFKRELSHPSSTWTYEEFIALAKMFYTGEDVPSGGYCLCGKNFLENIQKIDWSKHPEVKINVETNKLGWSVTRIHTVFGDLQFKREPTLDYAGFSNSCGIIAEGRLVHYSRTAEHSFSEAVEGQEAKRNGIIVWDGLALKGSAHIWVDGEGSQLGTGSGDNTTAFQLWSGEEAPEGDDLTTGMVYIFTQACSLTDSITAKSGESYQYTEDGWVKYTGQIYDAA